MDKLWCKVKLVTVNQNFYVNSITKKSLCYIFVFLLEFLYVNIFRLLCVPDRGGDVVVSELQEAFCKIVCWIFYDSLTDEFIFAAFTYAWVSIWSSFFIAW